MGEYNTTASRVFEKKADTLADASILKKKGRRIRMSLYKKWLVICTALTLMVSLTGCVGGDDSEDSGDGHSYGKRSVSLPVEWNPPRVIRLSTAGRPFPMSSLYSERCFKKT